MDDASKKIASLNDAFRRVMGMDGSGRVVKTRAINGFTPTEQGEIFRLVQTFNQFSEDNDPHGEHDFGGLDYKGNRILWKIDYCTSSKYFGHSA